VATDQLDQLCQLSQAVGLDSQAEAIEQLRAAASAFLRIHVPIWVKRAG